MNVFGDVRIGSLFSGYGGLEMGILRVFRGARVVFHVEHDAAPARILKHHWPDVPNLGDITRVDWSKAPRIHILCGGFPCQDVSPAGLRKGLRPGTRSGLWSHFALAIAELRPSLVIVENVRGLLSAEAHSELEPDAWAVGDGDDGPALRALGAVLGDLADLGYDAEWCCVPASAAGAPHRRERVFIVAYPQRDERARERPQQSGGTAFAGGGEESAADSAHVFLDWARRARNGWAQPSDGRDAPADSDGLGHAGTVSRGSTEERDADQGDSSTAPDSDGGRFEQGVGELHAGQPDAAGCTAANAGDNGRTISAECHSTTVKRPAGAHRDDVDRRVASDPTGEPRRPEEGRAVTAACSEPTGLGATQPPGLDRLATDAANDNGGRGAGARAETGRAWGEYGPAVARWEATLGRVAPAPTEDGRLSPAFVEWMMGLPTGHVTDVGLRRSQQLKALGNGVVPQQAALALTALLPQFNEAAS